MASGRRVSRSRGLAEKVLYAAFEVLKDNDGKCAGPMVTHEVERRVELDVWARGRYERSGYVRWQAILHSFVAEAMKAGYIKKDKGIWYLTAEGESVMRLGERGLLVTTASGGSVRGRAVGAMVGGMDWFQNRFKWPFGKADESGEKGKRRWKKFRVSGVDLDTGLDTDVVIEAPTEHVAKEEAEDRGIVVRNITRN